MLRIYYSLQAAAAQASQGGHVGTAGSAGSGSGGSSSAASGTPSGLYSASGGYGYGGSSSGAFSGGSGVSGGYGGGYAGPTGVSFGIPTSDVVPNLAAGIPGSFPNVHSRYGGDQGVAFASGSVGPNGVQQSAAVYPENPVSTSVSRPFLK